MSYCNHLYLCYPWKNWNLLLTEFNGWLVLSIHTPLHSGGEVIMYMEGLSPYVTAVKFIRGIPRKINFFFVIAYLSVDQPDSTETRLHKLKTKSVWAKSYFFPERSRGRIRHTNQIFNSDRWYHKKNPVSWEVTQINICTVKWKPSSCNYQWRSTTWHTNNHISGCSPDLENLLSLEHQRKLLQLPIKSIMKPIPGSG